MGKKVCITTYYNSPNYGSRLQSTALSLVLHSRGCEVSFLNRVKVLPFFIKHPQLLLSRIWNRLTDYKARRFFEADRYEPSEVRNKRLEEYSSKFFQEISLLTMEDIKKAKKDNIIFIVGSDIVWQPANGFPSKYFLDFAYYMKSSCFSYASSLGAKTIPWYYKGAIRKYLSAFTCVSTREQNTVELLSRIVGRKIEKVIDPTLLLGIEDWNKFADKAKYSENISQKYIFCYFVMHDQRYWDYVKLVQREAGCQVVILPMHYLDEEQDYTIIKDGTPYEFIDLIRNAEFILTDSFHACAFSLQYKKEFYLLRRQRKAEDAKYDDFLKRYHLENRQIIDEKIFNRVQDIDYELAHKILNKDRKKSMEFLCKALESSCSN